MWQVLVPIVGTVCTFAFVIVLTLSRGRVRELEVRERIAMIERGLVPPPEVDPRGFDRAMEFQDRVNRYRYRAPGRHRRAGVTLMGMGFGLMMLIGVAFGSVNAGIGVGGFFVIMGFAFFVNSLFDYPRDQDRTFAQPPSASANSEPARRD